MCPFLLTFLRGELRDPKTERNYSESSAGENDLLMSLQRNKYVAQASL